MKIKELFKPITNKDTIYKVLRGKFKVENAMILHMSTGTAWTYPILMQGFDGDDLIQAIDHIYNQDNDVLRLYSPEEALEDEFIDENYLPINGGEYYTDMIESVEFV